MSSYRLSARGALLEGKKLTIADPVPVSSEYDGSYYIGRRACCHKATEHEISDDNDAKKLLSPWLAQKKNKTTQLNDSRQQY
jgi:hypothetical protein